MEGGKWKPSTGIRDAVDGCGGYAVLTLHRPSNVDREETFAPIWRAISEVGERIPVIFPVHPRTRTKMEEFGLLKGNVRMIEPIGYIDMFWAVKGAKMVLTDSGGLQEETTVLGVPCITIRENTERPSTIEMGTNYLVGTDPDRILFIANEILEGKGKRGQVPPLWDGKTSERIVNIIQRDLMG
ncbi:MAG: UDP-N-acetylglucosamine 2-epimerase [bacterium]|nr:UDP-N-acetylglucosamine 2-epimerase [bacterium]